MGVTIERTKVYQVDPEPKTVRFYAKQSFVRQETPFVGITDSDGLTGRGYSYIIGTGGGGRLDQAFTGQGGCAGKYLSNSSSSCCW